MIIEKGGGDVAKGRGLHVTTPRQYRDSFYSPQWEFARHAVGKLDRPETSIVMAVVICQNVILNCLSLLRLSFTKCKSFLKLPIILLLCRLVAIVNMASIEGDHLLAKGTGRC
jgi:hypothetical protein